MASILVVCTGNVCRSPIAHAARRLLPEPVRAVDVVLAMATEHRDEIARSVPDARDRVFTLKELVRLLEALPPDDPAGSLPERVHAAATLRRSGFVGNPYDEAVIDPPAFSLR